MLRTALELFRGGGGAEEVVESGREALGGMCDAREGPGALERVDRNDGRDCREGVGRTEETSRRAEAVVVRSIVCSVWTQSGCDEVAESEKRKSGNGDGEVAVLPSFALSGYTSRSLERASDSPLSLQSQTIQRNIQACTARLENDKIPNSRVSPHLETNSRRLLDHLQRNLRGREKSKYEGSKRRWKGKKNEPCGQGGRGCSRFRSCERVEEG
jgi:hypothetical protein